MDKLLFQLQPQAQIRYDTKDISSSYLKLGQVCKTAGYRRSWLSCSNNAPLFRRHTVENGGSCGSGSQLKQMQGR